MTAPKGFTGSGFKLWVVNAPPGSRERGLWFPSLSLESGAASGRGLRGSGSRRAVWCCILGRTRQPCWQRAIFCHKGSSRGFGKAVLSGRAGGRRRSCTRPGSPWALKQPEMLGRGGEVLQPCEGSYDALRLYC